MHFDVPRWWAWTLLAAWRGQSARARWAQVVIPLSLVAAIIAVNAFPAPAAPRQQSFRASVPSPEPSPEPSPSPDATAPPVDNGPPLEVVRGGLKSRGAARGCPAVPAVGPMTASYFPRVYIPKVGINLEIHPGDGNTPPDHNWVAWFYPGMSHPGERGNTYVYAHAHGNPQGSAPGLFWPIHYMHPCDAVYIYTSPTQVYRYQAVVIDRNHSGYDDSPLNQTTDERVTLQTCNDWAAHGPKTIVVAQRYLDPGEVGGSTAGSGSGGGSSQPSEPDPQPSSSPSSKIPIPLPTHKPQ